MVKWFLAVACGALLLGCDILSEPVANSERAAARLIAAIGAEDYAVVRDQMTADLKDRFTLELTVERLAPVRAAVGACGAPRTRGYNANLNATGGVVHLTVNAHCSKGELWAILVWKLEAGEPRLSEFSFHEVLASSEEPAETPPDRCY